jgi:hypothetical protein
MAATPDDRSYFPVASNGGVFTSLTTIGPPLYGSTGSIVLSQPIVGISG